MSFTGSMRLDATAGQSLDRRVHAQGRRHLCQDRSCHRDARGSAPGDKVIPFGGGPIPAGMKMELTGIRTSEEGDTAMITARFKGAVDSIVWRMTPDGQLGLDILMLRSKRGNGYKGEFTDSEIRISGSVFCIPKSYARNDMDRERALRVWRNRQRGMDHGLWHKDYNNTVTGQWDEGSVYPEFKGYHANIYEARIESDTAPFTVRSETDGVYLRVFTCRSRAPGKSKPHHDRFSRRRHLVHARDSAHPLLQTA